MSKRRSFGGIRRLPSGRWQAFYTGPDGQRHTAPSTFTAKMDAEAWLVNERRAVEDPANWTPPKDRTVAALVQRKREEASTFGVYAEDWLGHRNLTPASVRNYRNLLDRYLIPTFGETPLSKITRTDVKTWHRNVAPGKAATRKHSYDLLRNILNSAVDDELIAVNPARIRGAGQVKRQTKTEPATLDELGTLVEACPERYRLMILLAAWCALRRGELTELRRGDVDTKTGVLRVRRSVTFITGERPIVGATKTEAGVRDVAIPDHLMPMVREHLLRHAQKGADGLMFPSPRGMHLRADAVQRFYYPAREAAGRPDLRFHDLRHTGAVLAAQSGATIAELMARLGHTTPNAAMRYQHAAADRDREIARRLSAMATEHAGGAAVSAEGTSCATCTRRWDRDRRDARHWIDRPDGGGLMCPVCQRRVERGEPLPERAVQRR